MEQHGSADARRCRPEELHALSQKLTAGTGQSWPAHPEITELDHDMVALMHPGLVPPRVGETDGISLAELIQTFLVPEVLNNLEESIAQVLRKCVVVVLVRSGRPHATAAYHPGKGVIISLDGALMLLFSDLLGHAMSLVSATESKGGLRYNVEEPKSRTVQAVASLLWSFWDPARPFNPMALPTVPNGSHGGEATFGKYLIFGERLILGHEFWHALNMLCEIGDPFGVRPYLHEVVSNSPVLATDEWVDEITADIGSIALMLHSVQLPGLRKIALEGALIGASFLGVLERAYFRPSSVQYPIDLSDIARHAGQFPHHPPAELRCAALENSFREMREEVKRAGVYRMAFDAIMRGLDDLSSGCCIALVPPDGWCGQERGIVGWFCPDHGQPLVVG